MSNDFMDLVAEGDLAEMVDGRLQISASGWLCSALIKAYDANVSEDERARSLASVSKLLDGARSRGFANTGTLLTLAANGAEMQCFASLARQAMEGATRGEVAAAVGPIWQEVSATEGEHVTRKGGKQ
ncbi:hypothetical protein [Paraburkholderia sp. BL21I4N1]|uniref:hypothetical protein n=1 Tax=Paraburkholderia sp. BL21I4N1 TaxID=1938801 RepID=UPI000CFD2CDD|nr:hypothetical protein [Paraburkholderia sp. BL21I4N1]PQV52922.1 hypothetical protein B0G83_1022 [Paraburkholderia sp. BL21I4N1]